jgi:hypothetical protein
MPSQPKYSVVDKANEILRLAYDVGEFDQFLSLRGSVIRVRGSHATAQLIATAEAQLGAEFRDVEVRVDDCEPYVRAFSVVGARYIAPRCG